MNKLTLFFLMISTVMMSQQDAQFTQYMYNTININPGYAGSRGVMSIFGLYRTQWVGLDGAPESTTFSLNTPLSNSNLGLGVSLISDIIGPTNENALSTDLSYTIRTSETFKLSFGLKATANFFNLDVNKLSPEHQGDAQFQNFHNTFSPNFGAGVYLHSDKAYLGFSIPNFIQTDRYNDNDVVIYKDKINYYLIGGYVFDLNPYETVKFKPSLLTKMVEGAPLQVDVSGSFLFNNVFSVGMSYRWSASVSALAGFQISNGLYVGYAYDHETTNLKNYSSGSHEIYLRFELFKSYNRMTSPRFF